MGKDEIIVMNLCGRGDKDIFTVGKILGHGTLALRAIGSDAPVERDRLATAPLAAAGDYAPRSAWFEGIIACGRRRPSSCR